VNINDFVLPDFEQLKPIYIQQSIRNIKKSSRFRENKNELLERDQYAFCIEKIKNKERLYKKDYRVLAYSLQQLEKDGYLDVFYNSFLQSFNSFRGISSFIRPFASYIYNNDETKNASRIYNLLTILRSKLPAKPKYRVIQDILDKNRSLSDFRAELKTSIQEMEELNGIENYCTSVFMKDTDKVYYHFIKGFIVKSHLKEDLWPRLKRIVETMDLEDKKAVFSDILVQHKDNTVIDSYPQEWFRFALRELKDPYDPSNTRWRGIEHVKDVFRIWNAYTNVLDFFINHVRGGDRRRLNFWKNYVGNIYRIRHFPEANMALVMEFEHHIFVEFAQHSNACYVYSKNHLNISDIERALEGRRLSRAEKVSFLKDRELCLFRLSHRDSWENNFDYRIRLLRYMESG
jgi:hypothetical protein